MNVYMSDKAGVNGINRVCKSDKAGVNGINRITNLIRPALKKIFFIIGEEKCYRI